jgi:hypothetical protein
VAAGLPPPAKEALALLAARLDQRDAELGALDRRLAARANTIACPARPMRARGKASRGPIPATA